MQGVQILWNVSERWGLDSSLHECTTKRILPPPISKPSLKAATLWGVVLLFLSYLDFLKLLGLQRKLMKCVAFKWFWLSFTFLEVRARILFRKENSPFLGFPISATNTNWGGEEGKAVRLNIQGHSIFQLGLISDNANTRNQIWLKLSLKIHLISNKVQ